MRRMTLGARDLRQLFEALLDPIKIELEEIFAFGNPRDLKDLFAGERAIAVDIELAEDNAVTLAQCAVEDGAGAGDEGNEEDDDRPGFERELGARLAAVLALDARGLGIGAEDVALVPIAAAPGAGVSFALRTRPGATSALRELPSSSPGRGRESGRVWA